MSDNYRRPTRADDAFDQKIHDSLCAIDFPHLAGGSDDEYEGEWKVQGRRRKDKKVDPEDRGKIKWKEDQPTYWIERTAKAYMAYFHGLTGKMFDFTLTPSTQKYISMLESALERNFVLSTFFTSRPIIWDLMGGSGADILSFLLNLDPLIVVACQKEMPEDRAPHETYESSKETFDIMVQNIKNFLAEFPEITNPKKHGMDRVPTTIRYKHLHAETYINSVPRGTEVDCVYLDPSWHKAGGYEQTPSELFDYLQTNIWGPIERRDIKVGCYVLKTRWNWLDVQKYLTMLDSKYIATYSIEAKQLRNKLGQKGEYGQVQGLFHYMILIHRDYQTIRSQNSQMYWDLVRNGETVWVKKDTVFRPVQPRYSDKLQFPAFKEADPHDDRYFMVTPPPALQQHHRAESTRVDVDKKRYYEEEPAAA